MSRAKVGPKMFCRLSTTTILTALKLLLPNVDRKILSIVIMFKNIIGEIYERPPSHTCLKTRIVARLRGITSAILKWFMMTPLMEASSALLARCTRNSPVTGEFPVHKPVTRSFDICFDLRLNKRLSTQSRGCWFETPSRSLWRHCIVT